MIPRYCELAVSAVTVRYGAWEQSGESGELQRGERGTWIAQGQWTQVTRGAEGGGATRMQHRSQRTRDKSR